MKQKSPNDRVRVELLALQRGGSGGISRYGQEVANRIQGSVDLQITGFDLLPLAHRFGPLRYLPLGVHGHRPGSLVHFTQLMGDILMAYRPMHPAVGTVHDLGRLVCPEDNELGGPIDRWLFHMQILGLRRMDHWIVNSDFTRRCLVDLLHIPEDRISWVQLGIDSENFRPVLHAREERARRFNIPPVADDVFDLVYVGNEQPRKGLKYLLEAMAILKARGLRTRLVKVGGAGGEIFRASFLKDAERLGVRDAVVFVNYVSDEDLPIFYSAADLYVCPTLLEGGFNWPVMESLACATPAVVTTAALVLPPAQGAVIETSLRSAGDFADAIAICMNDRERYERMAAVARPAVLPYTWDQTVSNLLSVYRQVADWASGTQVDPPVR